ILFILGSIAIFPVMNAITKHLGQSYSPVQVVWARALGHVLFVVLLFGPRLGLRPLFATRRPGLQLARSCCQLVSNTAFFFAIVRVPLAGAQAVSFIPPFIIAALAVPLLGERVGPRRWSAIAVGCLGALIVIRPGFGGGIHPWGAMLLICNNTAYSLYAVLT